MPAFCQPWLQLCLIWSISRPPHVTTYISPTTFWNQEIPLFVLSKCHPPSPDALRNPGLVNVFHRERGGPRVAPGTWRPPLAGEIYPSCLTHWVAYLLPGAASSASDVHFSQDHFTPYPTSAVARMHNGEFCDLARINSRGSFTAPKTYHEVVLAQKAIFALKCLM